MSFLKVVAHFLLLTKKCLMNKEMSDFDVMLDAYSPKQSLRLSLDSIILKYLCSSVVIKGLDDQHT